MEPRNRFHQAFLGSLKGLQIRAQPRSRFFPFEANASKTVPATKRERKGGCSNFFYGFFLFKIWCRHHICIMINIFCPMLLYLCNFGEEELSTCTCGWQRCTTLLADSQEELSTCTCGWQRCTTLLADSRRCCHSLKASLHIYQYHGIINYKDNSP